MKGQEELLEIIKRIAAGEYSEDILRLTRPEYPQEIREVSEAVGMMMVGIEARQYNLELLLEQLKANALKTVIGMANALSARDVYTKGHAERVSRYAERLARRRGMDEEEVEHVRIGGMLHDIGKIGFSDRLLTNSDTRPDPEMFEEIRNHPLWGEQILQGLDFLGPVLEFVRSHHERMDGTGYPHGVPAGELPEGVRIVAVADCFDAITTDRSYQQGRSVDAAFAILRKLAGDHLDPDLVSAFIAEIEAEGMEA
ncbi:MAG: HD-GYP domain-containing protein [Desulfovibrionaceae bacterium]